MVNLLSHTYFKEKKESEIAQSCPTLCNRMDCSLPGFSHPWGFPGESTGVGFHFLLQGIFLTQGSIPGLLHCRQMLYPLSLQGSHTCFKAHIIFIFFTFLSLMTNLTFKKICLIMIKIQVHLMKMCNTCYN